MSSGGWDPGSWPSVPSQGYSLSHSGQVASRFLPAPEEPRASSKHWGWPGSWRSGRPSAAALQPLLWRLRQGLQPAPPALPVSPLPSRPPGSGPVLVSPQTGCLWSWSAWRSSSSSSCWASAGVSAAPTPAAVTSGAPAARTNAAAQRPVSALRVSPPPLPQASLLDPRRGGGHLPASRGSATHLAEQLGGKGLGRTGSFGLSSIYSSFSLIFPFYLF